jgi:FkbM family methyltransferase
MPSPKILKSMLRQIGLDIHRYQPPMPQVIARNSLQGCLQQAIQNGLNPKTIIDVGVATGTPDIYHLFPHAHHVLIEPLEENIPYLQRWVETLESAEYILAAGQMQINVHPDLVGSSVYKEDEDSEVNGVERSIPTVTLDQVAIDRQLEGSYLIKIDTQGSELDVLAGASVMLEQTDFVILEVSFFNFFQGAPTALEYFQFMKNQGFVIYDIFEIDHRLLDGAMSQANIAFVKENSILRQHHYYATKEQRQEQNQRLLELDYHQ